MIGLTGDFNCVLVKYEALAAFDQRITEGCRRLLLRHYPNSPEAKRQKKRLETWGIVNK
jgi:hypothetical protein